MSSVAVSSAALAIDLRASPRIAVGCPHPIAVAVSNRYAQAILLVGVVDGAESEARSPAWRARVWGPAGPLARPERPDHVRPLLPVDFRLLQPGESFDPTRREADAHYFALDTFERVTEAPGRYEAVLELDMRAESPADWLGDGVDRRAEAGADRAEAMRRLARVPRILVRSNRVHVEVY